MNFHFDSVDQSVAGAVVGTAGAVVGTAGGAGGVAVAVAVAVVDPVAVAVLFAGTSELSLEY